MEPALSPAVPPAARSRSVAWLAVWSVAACAFTLWLGRLDLNDPDEARHAEIAREMLATGSWLTPRVEGLPYYDKPPLVHWLVAVSMRCFGEHAAAARLPSVLAAFVTLAATAWWTTRVSSARAARWAVIGLSTTFLFVAIGRTVIVDMPFAAALTVAFASLGVAWVEAGGRSSLLPFHLGIAVATLIKGPAAIALALLLVAALAVIDPERLKRTGFRPLVSASIVLMCAGPWYAAAWLSEPDYIETFLWTHNVQRYLSQLRIHWAEPWFYYLLALPAALLPWTPLVVVAVARLARSRERQPADVYAMVCAAVVVGFFSPAGTRLVTYLLPALPPLAALTADSFARQRPFGRNGYATTRLGVYAAVVAATLALAGAVVLSYAHTLGQASTADAAALLPILLVLCLAANVARRHGSESAAMAAIAGSTLAAVPVAYMTVAGLINAERSLRPVAELVRRELPESAVLVTYGTPAHALSFYSGRVARPTKTPSVAAAALAESAPAALLTRSRYLPELTSAAADGPGAERWPSNAHQAAGGGRVLILNPAAAALAGVPADSGPTQMAEKGGSRTLRRP